MPVHSLVGRLLPNTMTIPSTTLCLVRHGETAWNREERIQGNTDIPLNDAGRKQAHGTAAALSREHWDILVASPLSRAMETAEIIAAAVGVAEVHPEPDLTERAFGDAEGIRSEDRRTRYPDGNIPGAESWDRVRGRALQAIERVRARWSGQRVIVVSHGGTIINLLNLLSGGEYGPRRVRIDNAAMSLIEYDGAWRVMWCNRTGAPATADPV